MLNLTGELLPLTAAQDLVKTGLMSLAVLLVVLVWGADLGRKEG